MAPDHHECDVDWSSFYWSSIIILLSDWSPPLLHSAGQWSLIAYCTPSCMCYNLVIWEPINWVVWAVTVLEFSYYLERSFQHLIIQFMKCFLFHGRGQREFSIPGILDESQLHFFSLDHEKWFSEVSISSRNMRVTKWNLVLVSKYENGHMIISISSRQARARKIILNLVSKNCTFSRKWEWDSKSNPITELHSK